MLKHRISIALAAIFAALALSSAPAVAVPLPGDPPGTNSSGLCTVAITDGRISGITGFRMSVKTVCHEPGITHIIITGTITSDHGPYDKNAHGTTTVLTPTPGTTYPLTVSGMFLRNGHVKGKAEVAIFQNIDGCITQTYVETELDFGDVK